MKPIGRWQHALFVLIGITMTTSTVNGAEVHSLQRLVLVLVNLQ